MKKYNLQKKFLIIFTAMIITIIVSSCTDISTEGISENEESTNSYVIGFLVDNKTEFNTIKDELISADIKFTAEESNGEYNIYILYDELLIEKLEELDSENPYVQTRGKKVWWTIYWPDGMFIGLTSCMEIKKRTRFGAWLAGKAIVMKISGSPVCFVRKGKWENTGFCDVCY